MLEEILAKSNPPETLIEHTENVLSVFHSIKQAFPLVPSLCQVPHFYEHLFYAITIHDLGKAAEGFQTKWGKWGYRHEILSAGFVKCIPDLDEFTYRAISLSIATHHKDIKELRERFNTTSNTGKENFVEKRNELFPSLDYIHHFLQKIPDWSTKFLGHTVKTPILFQETESILDAYQYAVKWYWYHNQENQKNSLHYQYGIFLRGFLIACDHLASSGKQEIIIKINDLVSRLGIASYRSFQKKAGELKGSGFLLAPTGSGKTEASMLWATNNQKDGGRIFYVLPYTASINAMVKRFSKNFGDENVGVLHGKASYFVYKALLDKDYSLETAARFAHETQGLTKKLYRPLKILTPFQILKAFFGVKGWESLLSEMAGGVFIFDEIHVYDARTTALILTTLKQLKGLHCDILFMSATFPDFLRKKILEILPNLPELTLDNTSKDDFELLNTPRHRVNLLQGEIVQHISCIQEELNSGTKVLVVCNTVQRAQVMYSQLHASSKKLLHGRFILSDREKIETEILSCPPQLLVGTQAIEVSLDLDYDTIFTEPAPIDALIQRFGRVNRKGKKGTVQVRICTNSSDRDKYFYDMKRVENTLALLPNNLELSHITVQDLVKKVYADGYNQQEQQTFLETQQAFESVISKIVPFIDTEDDDSLYDLIRSVQVVPKGKIEQEYLEFLDKQQYFEAIRCFATISLGQGMRLRKLEAMTNRKIKIERKIHSYYSVDVEYDDDLGLILESITSQGVFID